MTIGDSPSRFINVKNVGDVTILKGSPVEMDIGELADGFRVIPCIQPINSAFLYGAAVRNINKNRSGVIQVSGFFKRGRLIRVTRANITDNWASANSLGIGYGLGASSPLAFSQGFVGRQGPGFRNYLPEFALIDSVPTQGTFPASYLPMAGQLQFTRATRILIRNV